MVLSDEEISALKLTLLEQGCVWSTDKSGDRLFFVHSRLMPGMPNGVLISYEGKGSFFFGLDRPLNRFRLISAGFPLNVAPWLADLVNRLTGFANPNRPDGPQRIAASSVKHERTDT